MEQFKVKGGNIPEGIKYFMWMDEERMCRNYVFVIGKIKGVRLARCLYPTMAGRPDLTLDGWDAQRVQYFKFKNKKECEESITRFKRMERLKNGNDN